VPDPREGLGTEARLVGVMTLYAAEPFGNLQVRRLEMITPHLASALAALDVEKPRRSARDLRVVTRRELHFFVLTGLNLR